MTNITDVSENTLRNALWDLANGRMPGHGLSNYSREQIRAELARRGLSPEGYHNT